MTNIREYLPKKEKKEASKAEGLKQQIRAHRMKMTIRVVSIAAVLTVMCGTAFFLLKNLYRVCGRYRNGAQAHGRKRAFSASERICDIQ